REKKYDNKNDNCRKGGGERCACAAFFINQRLRRATANGKAATESSEQVRSSECQIFLISIEPSAVLRSEHSPNRGRFDCAEKKAGQGEWQELVQILPVDGRQFERRNSLWHGADQLYAVCLERKRRCGDDSPDHDEKRDRFVFEQNFPKKQYRQRACPNQK